MNRTKKVECVMGGPFVKLYDLTYENKSGKNKMWRFASRRNIYETLAETDVEKAEAILIVPIYYGEKTDSYKTKSPKIVVTKEYRAPLGGYEYGCPAGLIDSGESWEKAAERELFEETGLIMDRIIYATPPIYSSAGVTDEAIQVVFVECHGVPSIANNEEDEDIEVIIIPFSDMWDIVNHRDHRFADGRIGSKAYLSWIAILSNLDPRQNYNRAIHKI